MNSICFRPNWARTITRLGLPALMAAAFRLHAATVWDGPVTTYTQTSLQAQSPLNAASQDRITANTWITRAINLRLFNARTETFGDKGGVNPANTMWASGNLTNYSTLTYRTFNSWLGTLGGGDVNPKILGVNAVVHLVSEDIYLSVKFTGWAKNGAGGFSYQRSTAPLPAPTVSITNPVANTVLAAPASILIQATAALSGGTVTNVTFRTNGIAAGSALAPPFALALPNLPAGPYALTAIATGAGLSTTSAVVNISVAPAPTITLTNPVGGSVFAAPASLQLLADASVPGGTVTNVAFFGNNSLLGSDQAAPFSLTTSALNAGGYALTAVATAGGLSTTSSVATITVVNPVDPVLAPPTLSNGLFSFSYPVDPGLRYVVQNSSNLLDWVSVATNQATGNPAVYSEPFQADELRAYRVGRLPNP